MGLSSNILWHQTDENGFYDILHSKKLLYSYSREKIILLFDFKAVAFPMISVSDYPLSEIGNNQWAYGDYCIGFKQSWGIKAGFSPVCYYSYGSHSYLQLNSLLHEAIKSNSKKLFGLAMFLFSNMKFVQAPLETKSRSFKNYRFYDEREWRVVPTITETDKAEALPFLTEDAYLKYKDEHNGSAHLEIGKDFQYSDINYIIVSKEADLQKTREIVGDKCHIFTKEEIVEDVVGVNHHEEVLPSVEQSDYEAAMRHMNRISEKWMAAFEKKKNKHE